MSTSPSQRASTPESGVMTSDDVNDDDSQQFQQIIRDRKYEHEDIQKKAFTKWINNQLLTSKSSLTVTDLFQDLRDGVILLRLLEVLTGNEYKRENGKMRVHHIENVNKVIAVLNEHGIKLLNISSNDIVDGSPKLTLGLIWSIIQNWQGRDVIKAVEPDSQPTNIENFLLSWCQQQTNGYKNVKIVDFTRSWQDGLAFNALIHKFRPDLFDYDELLQNASARNLEHAFSLAKKVFKIDRYLDVEDVLTDFPDKKSLLMYVMCLFQQLPSSDIIIEDKDASDNDETKSASASVSIQMTAYQTNMAKIIQWISTLENELNTEKAIETKDLKTIKEQFQTHEEFMIGLTRDQNQIGDVLEEGNQLLTSPENKFSAAEALEIKEQMKTLNRRWEALRSKSLEKQSILHKTLMQLQMSQVESFHTWLTETERRISTDLEVMASNLDGLERQYQQLALVQDELVAQQQITESLQNMIIVLDESSSTNQEQTSTEIESTLLSLSERWAQICNFVQTRWIQIQEVKIEFEKIELNREKVNKWLTIKELEVKQIEAQDTDILTQQIQKIESEKNDIRQSILTLSSSLQTLNTHYANSPSNELKLLNDQIQQFEQRWTQLISALDRCVNHVTNSTTATTDTNEQVITNTAEDTSTFHDALDDSEEKTTKNVEKENQFKSEFDISARKYSDWIDSIERILDPNTFGQSPPADQQSIIREVKAKYTSYDEPFQALVQNGNAVTKQLNEDEEDSSEHQSSLQTLQSRWQELHKQILFCENLLERSKFNNDLEELTQAQNAYEIWLESTASSSISNADLQVKLKNLPTYYERLAYLRRMADRFDTNAVQRTDDLLRSWDETSSRLRERSIPVEHMQQQPSGLTDLGVTTSFRQTISSSSSLPASPTRIGGTNAYPSSAAATSSSSAATATTTGATKLEPSIGENGSLFTLTNIYTFGGGDGNSNNGLSDLSSDKYRVKSFVEVFDQPSSSTQQESEYERRYRETHSSSSFTRKVRTSATDTYDYGQNGDYDSSRHQHHYERTSPVSTKYIHEQLSSGTGNLSSLPSIFTDTQRKVRLWIEHVEQSLSNDKVRIGDIHTINVKRRVYKDLLDQTFEQEHHLKSLNDIAREYSSRLTTDVNRRLQTELTSYQDHLNDIKIFLSERLTKYTRYEKTLNDFESQVEEVKQWIRNVQPRLVTSDTTSRGLENQLDRNQTVQHEIREMQIIINRLNKDVLDLSQDADENLAQHLKDEMKQLNESWSHVISSTKVYSQNIQDTLKRNRVLQEEIRELEDWITDRERETALDDGSIFYQEQLRERLEQYQKLQSELNLKEYNVRTLVNQARHDAASQSYSPELVQSLDALITHWSNLQKKIDSKVAFYSDFYKLHEDLKDLLARENTWLDQLQNKIYHPASTGASADETTEELDSLERFVKGHSRTNYDRIIETFDRLQSSNISLTSTNSQLNQFRVRWDQLHEDASRKLHSLGSQVSDYQQLEHQITSMFEWMRYTDNILNSRLKGNVYADDVPAEYEKLLGEFNQYEVFLHNIEEKVLALHSQGKNDAAKRLEQQLSLLKNQFAQLQRKFRQFQKPSDFEPKYNKVRQILNEIEQHIHTLEIRSDDPDVVHNQLENVSKLYKTLSDIKSEVEYVIRVGRDIVSKQQTDEYNDLIRQLEQLKTTYNTVAERVSIARTRLDGVERHLRKFRKEYSHVHEWFVKADQEIRKIENKQVSKNTKEEVDWIRTTRNDIKKLEANFEALRNLERTIQKDAEKQLPNLHGKITELKRQIDQLERRLKDRSEIVDGQVRRLDDEYQRFTHMYKEIIVRLEKLESLLSDAERVLDVTRISQVQEEIRSVRTQLDETLNLGQELISKSDKYSKFVGPEIENIIRKFEELQRRIRIIQDHSTHDRTEYEEIERVIRETEERAYIIEKTDVEQARRIREKIRRLKECLENLRNRSDHHQSHDEIVQYHERFAEHVHTTDRTVPRERDFDSDFIYDIDDTRSVISEPAPQHNTKYRKTVHSHERYRTDDHGRYVPTHEEYQLQPLLRVRSLKAIDHRTISAPSSPILQPRYRSYERSNVQYTKQSSNQQGHQDNYQSSISKSASMPNGGFPIQQNLLPHPPPPPHFYHQQPMMYRERVIDKHVAERSTSRGESHRQQQQESSTHAQQQQQQQQQQRQESGGHAQRQVRSASATGHSSTMNRSIPVQYEPSNVNGATFTSTGFRTTNGHSQEQHPNYFYTEQQGGGGGGGGGGAFRQQAYDQQAYPPQNVGRHPTRIAN